MSVTSSTFDLQQRTLLEIGEDIFQRWRRIGTDRGFETDGQTATFLVELYEKDQHKVDQSSRCAKCNGPLSLLCAQCNFTTQLAQDSSSLSFRDNPVADPVDGEQSSLICSQQITSDKAQAHSKVDPLSPILPSTQLSGGGYGTKRVGTVELPEGSIKTLPASSEENLLPRVLVVKLEAEDVEEALSQGDHRSKNIAFTGKCSGRTAHITAKKTQSGSKQKRSYVRKKQSAQCKQPDRGDFSGVCAVNADLSVNQYGSDVPSTQLSGGHTRAKGVKSKQSGGRIRSRRVKTAKIKSSFLEDDMSSGMEDIFVSADFERVLDDKNDVKTEETERSCNKLANSDLVDGLPLHFLATQNSGVDGVWPASYTNQKFETDNVWPADVNQKSKIDKVWLENVSQKLETDKDGSVCINQNSETDKEWPAAVNHKSETDQIWLTAVNKKTETDEARPAAFFQKAADLDSSSSVHLEASRSDGNDKLPKKHSKKTLHSKFTAMCKECGATFASGSSLKQHIMRVHTMERPFVCDTCGRGFVRKKDLMYHTKQKHTGERPYKCDMCDSAFVAQSSLKSHMGIHYGTKQHVCHICGATFLAKGSLNIHMRVHTKEKPYQCPECELSFSQRGNMLAHMRQHTGEKPFQCAQCGARFRVAGTLKTHMMMHKGEHPFSCVDCGKSFITSGALKIHQRTHTGDKPYACSACGLRFSNSTLVNRHMRTHTGERPYLCRHCGFAFRRSHHLKSHIMRKHPHMLHSTDHSAVKTADSME